MHCPNVKQFWVTFFTWWNRVADMNIPLDIVQLEENIVFGCQNHGEIANVLNFCLLIAKYYIYKQKLFVENKIDFYEFLIELKYKLNMEYHICLHNNTLVSFNKFQFVFEQL